MSRPLRAIVFDFDGVIANSEPLHLLAFQQGSPRTASSWRDRLLLAVSRLRRRGDVRGTGAGSRDVDAECACGGVGRAQGRSHAGPDALGIGALSRRTRIHPRGGAAVPIAIASGALRHEIDEIIDAAGVADLFADRRGRRYIGEQTVACAVSPRVRAAARADGSCARSETLGCHRGLALGSRIRTRRGSQVGWRDEQLFGWRTRPPRLVVNGLSALTLPALDKLCAS